MKQWKCAKSNDKQSLNDNLNADQWNAKLSGCFDEKV